MTVALRFRYLHCYYIIYSIYIVILKPLLDLGFFPKRAFLDLVFLFCGFRSAIMNLYIGSYLHMTDVINNRREKITYSKHSYITLGNLR